MQSRLYIALFILLAFGIYILILLLLAYFLPQKYTHFIVRLILKVFVLLSGRRLYIIYGNIKKAQLIAANHESMIETFILMIVLKKPCFIYKKELNDIFILGKIIQKLDMIPIDRNYSSREQREQMNILAEKAILNKRTVVIFPQGSRVKCGQYKKFKKGVIHLSNILNVPITSIALKSVCNIVPRYLGIIRTILKIYVIESKFYSSIEELEEIILNKYHDID